MKSKKLAIYFLSILFVISILGCKKDVDESSDYAIISAVLNSAFGNESDDENGLGWIDTTKEYNSLLLLNHTNLRQSDIQIINDYLEYQNIAGFSIEDFKNKHKWDIEKIKDYNRYQLEVLNDQDIKSPYIGMAQISSISYNQTYDGAIIFVSFLCAGSGDCGFGKIYHLKKEDKWKIEKEEILEVS